MDGAWEPEPDHFAEGKSEGETEGRKRAAEKSRLEGFRNGFKVASEVLVWEAWAQEMLGALDEMELGPQ